MCITYITTHGSGPAAGLLIPLYINVEKSKATDMPLVQF